MVFYLLKNNTNYGSWAESKQVKRIRSRDNTSKAHTVRGPGLFLPTVVLKVKNTQKLSRLRLPTATMAGKQIGGDGVIPANLAGMTKSQLYGIMSQMKVLFSPLSTR